VCQRSPEPGDATGDAAGSGITIRPFEREEERLDHGFASVPPNGRGRGNLSPDDAAATALLRRCLTLAMRLGRADNSRCWLHSAKASLQFRPASSGAADAQNTRHRAFSLSKHAIDAKRPTTRGARHAVQSRERNPPTSNQPTWTLRHR